MSTDGEVIVIEESQDVIVVSEAGIQGPAGQDGSGGGSTTKKAGNILNSAFSGSPLKYSVVFSTAYSNTNYTISITGADARFWTIESKTVSGFIINSNATDALTGSVSWFTTPTGETT